MKKGISISLLCVFFLFQTGRILLYFECRFSNSITTTSCDCNKILTDTKPGTPNDIPANSHANHRHLPEEFEMERTLPVYVLASIELNKTSVYTAMISPGHCTDIFHPPIN